MKSELKLLVFVVVQFWMLHISPTFCSTFRPGLNCLRILSHFNVTACIPSQFWQWIKKKWNLTSAVSQPLGSNTSRVSCGICSLLKCWGPDYYESVDGGPQSHLTLKIVHQSHLTLIFWPSHLINHGNLTSHKIPLNTYNCHQSLIFQPNPT